MIPGGLNLNGDSPIFSMAYSCNFSFKHLTLIHSQPIPPRSSNRSREPGIVLFHFVRLMERKDGRVQLV
jgi:hypothetical protein